jgi:hypothetical protein
MPSLARRLNVGQHGYEPARPIRGLTQGPKARRFVASISDDDTPAHENVKATDFLQAALTFAETCAADHPGESLKICVTDTETGETQCFNLNLAA